MYFFFFCWVDVFILIIFLFEFVNFVFIIESLLLNEKLDLIIEEIFLLNVIFKVCRLIILSLIGFAVFKFLFKNVL